MDEGPFRAPQPVERRVPARHESAPRQAVEKPEPVKEAPKPSYRAERTQVPPLDEPKKRGSFKRLLGLILAIIVLLGIGLGAWTVFSKTQSNAATGIDTSKYQAVFFTNGEVYFGKLQPLNEGYMKLTEIFYLHSDTAASSTKTTEDATESTDAQLIKLGNEAYGPEDAMIISRDQVSRYMNLKSDSKVVQLIDKYTAK